MATNYWRHPADTDVAQVWKGTVTTTTNGHTYIVTITDDDGTTAAISYAVVNPPDTTVTLVATGFITAWNASTNPLIARFTATQSAGQVILTADAAGVPASFAATGTGTWSGTGNTTANTGNNDYNTAKNWFLDAIPASTNNVIFDAGSVGVKYGLDQSGVDIADFRVLAGCSTQFGDFRLGVPHYLRIDPDLFRYEGSGSLAMFNIGSAAISPYIAATGSPSATGRHTVYIKGSAISTLYVDKGNVGVAPISGETATITTIQTGFVSTQASDVNLTVGAGVTLTTWHHGGGVGTLKCAATTLNLASGTQMTTEGSGAITTINVYGGTHYLNSTGTITTLNIYGGTVYLSKNRAARTVTTTNLYNSATLYTGSWITHTNKPFPAQAGSSTLVYVG